MDARVTPGGSGYSVILLEFVFDVALHAWHDYIVGTMSICNSYGRIRFRYFPIIYLCYASSSYSSIVTMYSNMQHVVVVAVIYMYSL